MKDQNVEVLLHTPLLHVSEREGSGSIVRILGKIIRETDAGFLIASSKVGGIKTPDKKSPFSQIFIPYHKIDHVVIV